MSQPTKKEKAIYLITIEGRTRDGFMVRFFEDTIKDFGAAFQGYFHNAKIEINRVDTPVKDE